MTQSIGNRQIYRVELDAYSGPLDLLLYLVKRHEIDLHDLPLADLTEQYLEHLKVIQFVDVESAGDFLVMAATLLEIKSQMLVPHAVEPEDPDQDPQAQTSHPTDPRYELVQQLLAYKRFKEAAIGLEHRQHDWAARFASRPKSTSVNPTEIESAQPLELDLEDVHVLDLCKAFARIIDSIGRAPTHDITYDDTPISLHAEDVFDRLTREGPMSLQEIFIGRGSRSEMIGLFLAILELVRNRRVRVLQQQLGGEIHVEAQAPDIYGTNDDSSDKPPDWRDSETGQMQYDWPDEAARQNSEKRKKLRADRLARMRAGEPVDNLDVEQHHDSFEGIDEEPFISGPSSPDTT